MPVKKFFMQVLSAGQVRKCSKTIIMKATAQAHSRNWPVVLLLALSVLCENVHSATPARQRLKPLDYAYQYQPPAWSNAANTNRDDSARLLKVQQQQLQTYEATNLNDIEGNYKCTHNERSFYGSTKPQGYLVAYQQQQQQQDIQRFKTYNTDEIYDVAKQKYMYQYSLPANAYRTSPGLNSQATRPSLAAEVVYAREPLSQHDSASAAGDAHTTNKHKYRSNQLLHAPKRQPERDTRPAYSQQLPYPPSFISITSTTTTTPSPLPNRVDTELSKFNNIPDIFAKRQHTSLLESYIPSWVMVRMLQQHKRQQQKQLHKFVATHTLAYPITKTYAAK